jgi:hypothetical protein
MTMNRVLSLGVWGLVVWTVFSQRTVAAPPWIMLDSEKQGFVTESGEPFLPWGVNYDRIADGRLLEDYWVDDWPRVVEDLAEIRELGFNVARIHLQTGRFLKSPTEVEPAAIAQLQKLVAEAERQGLYLNLTGLGCYHKADVPEWYEVLEEEARWSAQRVFWRAVAGAVARSPAVFCLNLMNEPVVSGGPRSAGDWLGPAFAGKHFVQFINLDSGSRARPAIARAWIEQLVREIRTVNPRHLLTVGLVEWSLDRPGLTSGFIPAEVTQSLDFVSVHLYPQGGKVTEAIETLRGFSVGKPVIIEETFPLGCSLEEMDEFLQAARPHAAGVVSFYWGQTMVELEQQSTLSAAITKAWLARYRQARWAPAK